MSKKTFFIRFFGIMAFSTIFITTASYAAQYYNQYPGNSFQPKEASSPHYKSIEGYIYHNDTTDGYYFCEVDFNVPDGSAYFIKSMGMRYKDNLSNGDITVVLYRLNLYTGAFHTVAQWQSSYSGASSSIQTASKGTDAGFKLVDTKKFAYWLSVNFYVTGDVNPLDNLMLFQVRIHYGT